MKRSHLTAVSGLALVVSTFFLPPHSRVAAQEPEPCTGYWAHQTAAFSSAPVTGIAVLPDGRLVAGLNGSGLRVFRPVIAGAEYGWATLAGQVSNAVTRLLVVGSELWVGTEGGLSVLDLPTGGWRSYTMANSPLPSNVIRSLTRGGIDIWIGTAAGAARLRRILGSESWTVLDANDGFRPGDADVRDIAAPGTVWIAGRSRMYRWSGAGAIQEVTNTGDCRHETASRMLVDLQSDIWFGALDEVSAIRAEEGGGGAVLVPTGLCHESGGIWTGYSDGLGFFVNDLAVDGAGRIWAALSGRAAMHDQGTWCFYEQESGLFSDDVRAVATAGEGVWFGHGDLPRLTFHSPNWSRTSASELGASGSFGAVLHAGGKILAGVGNRIASATGEAWASVALPVASPVSALGLDGAGQLCAGTLGGDVFVEVAPMSFAPMNGPGLPAGMIRALESDGQGRLWAATPNGLALRGNGYWLPFTKDDSGLGTNDLRSLAVDAQDRLWIASDRGIYVLAIDPAGPSTWSSFDTTTGLPSDDVRALAVGQGVVWAATAAGAAAWDGAAWSAHDTASGALPGDDALAVTFDPAGRAWVGTTRGLARHEGNQWTHFHPTGSTLSGDRVTALAASDTQLWAANGTVLARRDEITGPIGFAPPTISGFTPTSGSAGTGVTINGTGFDSRRGAFNYVTIGESGPAGTGFPARAGVTSATATELVIVVPADATSGKIRVTAHELTAVSAGSFTVRPRISLIQPTCVTLGTKLEITGSGFLSGGSTVQIKVGNGSWRNVDGQRASSIESVIRSGDTAGQVRVRLSNGVEVIAPQEVSIGSFALTDVRIQQAIAGTPLVWGKRTLVHLDFGAVGCLARVTGGRFEWKRNDGTYWGQDGVYLAAPGGSSAFVSRARPIDVASFGVDFVSRTPDWPLSRLAGGRVSLTNNGVEILSTELQRSEFFFVAVAPPPKLIAIGVHAASGNGTYYRDFWDNAWESLEHVARMYPAREAVRWGSNPWITWTPTLFTVSAAYLGVGDDDEENEALDNNYCDIKGRADDIVDPDFGELVMALVDGALYQEGSSGRAPVGPPIFSGLTGVSFNLVKTDDDGKLEAWRSRTGPIIAQELGHMLGVVDDSASNHDRGNEHHSRFDEGEGEDDDGCARFKRLTFNRALLGQTGSSIRNVVRLDGGRPWDHLLDACASGRPRSVMSYVSGNRNSRGHLEPADFDAIRAAFAFMDNIGGGGGQRDGGDLLGVGGGASRALRIRGTIWTTDAIQVGVCYLTDTSKPFTPSDPEGRYRLELLAADGAPLGTYPFSLRFHAHGGPVAAERFALHVPFPDETTRVEILHDARVLWAKNLSENPPVVSFASPVAGNVIDGAGVTTVRWTASDPDGGELQFALDYSPDGGATWHKLPQYLTGSSYEWQPLYLPASQNARLRIRASDGFLTQTALSAAFTLVSPAPIASTRKPDEGQVFLEGERVDLVGASITADGEPGTFHWEVDGTVLGDSGPETSVVLDLAGPHTIRLRVTDAVGVSSEWVERTVEVLADHDGDGLPNDYEREHGFDPLYFGDAGEDADDDGISNLGEYRRGTDPRNPDSDGDGWSDGEEQELQTSPLHASDSPSLTPLLLVGAERIGFTAHEGEPAPEPTRFWITNGAGGVLSWSAIADAPWVTMSPSAGTAPTEVALGVDPTGLAVGLHEALVTVTAPGADESPQTITVRLEVRQRRDSPGLPRFVRGDCNGDGRVSGAVTDAVVLLRYNFSGGAEPPCLAACDADGDGRVTGAVTDAIYLLGFNFLGGPPPLAPFPGCGTHPAVDPARCRAFPPCE